LQSRDQKKAKSLVSYSVQFLNPAFALLKKMMIKSIVRIRYKGKIYTSFEEYEKDFFGDVSNEN